MWLSTHIARARILSVAGTKKALSTAAFAIQMGLAVLSGSAPAAEPDYVRKRAVMVDEIAIYAAELGSMIGRDRISPRVLETMRIVPRHEFVPEDVRESAYADRPLPIGYGQTISQPFIVALMTDLLQVEPHHVVLEVGTGSGYQAAILASLAHQVYTIEIVPPLANTAAERLQRLGYANVATRQGDGYYGWEGAAPFDGIIVTAAATHIPQPLLDQLKPGRRLVIPIGEPHGHQELMVVEKGDDGAIDTRRVLGVAFVPLTGEQA